MLADVASSETRIDVGADDELALALALAKNSG